MGVWGVKIFENDTALDVREQYLELLRNGDTALEASDRIIKLNQDIIGTNDNNELDFWLSLATVQWQNGKLQPFVKYKVIERINKNCFLELWEHDEYLLNKRKKVIEEFLLKINSTQPKEKKCVSKLFICKWNIGDIFAYKLSSKESEERKVFGKYIVFQKTNEMEAYPKLIIPVIRLANNIYDNIPSIVEYVSAQKQICYTPHSFIESDELFHIKRNKILYDEGLYIKSLKGIYKNIYFIGNQLPIKTEYKEDVFNNNYRHIKFFEKLFFMFFDYWKNVDVKEMFNENMFSE